MVPAPTSDVTVIVPAWAVTISRATNRPSPRPVLARVARPGVRVEQAGQVLGRDARAVVPDTDLGVAVGTPNDDLDRLRPRPVLDRIGEQVEDDLLETARIALDRQRGRAGVETDRGRVRQDGGQVDRLAHDRRQVHRSRHDLELAGLDPADVVQPLDQLVEALRLDDRPGGVGRRLGRVAAGQAPRRPAGGSCGWPPSAS